jgi:tungstate transport system substrate-binding protein
MQLGAGAPGHAYAADSKEPIVFAVGTSTYDTGLLDFLLPPFETESGYEVKIVAVGSGQALAMAERGEADLVLSHAPDAEMEFMARELGETRRRLMSNGFIVVGPASDPAGVRRARSALDAFTMIARSEASFVSRGDESGTHMLEKRLWRMAENGPPAGTRYVETGQGQGTTLRVASEKRAYALTDRGTFLVQERVVELGVLYEGDPILHNVYHLIVSNPGNGPRVNADGARQLASFLLSPETLERLAGFGRKRYGRPLFVSDAEPHEPGSR